MDILITDCQKSQKRKTSKNKIKKLAKEILKNLRCPEDIEISILLTDDTHIRELNRKYRKKDKPTDVLSFPQGAIGSYANWKLEIGNYLYPANCPLPIGDVVISVETVEKQAVLEGISFDEEIIRLLIHGILHLFGFEHEKGGQKAKAMRGEEKRLYGLCCFHGKT